MESSSCDWADSYSKRTEQTIRMGQRRGSWATWWMVRSIRGLGNACLRWDSHSHSRSLLSLRCFLRGWCFFAVWVLACCSLCLLCQGLRCLSFLLDRQVLQNVFICFSFLFDCFPDRVFLCFYQLVPLLIQWSFFLLGNIKMKPCVSSVRWLMGN